MRFRSTIALALGITRVSAELKNMTVNLSLPILNGMMETLGLWNSSVDYTGNGAPIIWGWGGPYTTLSFNFPGSALYLGRVPSQEKENDPLMFPVQQVGGALGGEGIPDGNYTVVDNILSLSGDLFEQQVVSIGAPATSSETQAPDSLPYVTAFNIVSVTYNTTIRTEVDEFENSDKLVDRFNLNGTLNPKFEWSNFGWMANAYGESVVYGSVVDQDYYRPPSVNISVPYNTSFLMINGTKRIPAQKELKGTGSLSCLRVDFRSSDNLPKWISDGYYTVSEHPTLLSGAKTVPLFFTPLDPALTYSLTLSPLSTSGVNIESITFYSGLSDGYPNSTSTTIIVSNNTGNLPLPEGIWGGDSTHDKKKKRPGEVIAGAVIGGVVALIIIVVLTWYFATNRVRQQRKNALNDNETFEIDPSLGPTPFAFAAVGGQSQQGEGKAMGRGGNEWMEEVPSHATDGGQLPPLYDPSWTASSSGPSSSGPSSSGLSRSNTSRSSSTGHILAPMSHVGGYSSSQLAAVDEKKPLIY